MKIFGLFPYTILASISKTTFDASLTRTFISYRIVSNGTYAGCLGLSAIHTETYELAGAWLWGC